MELHDIRDHWEQVGRDFPMDSAVTPTSRDPYLGQLERENIIEWLRDHHVCLEVGCGDASHTVHYAQRVKQLTAIDVAESLVDIARKRLDAARLRNIVLRAGSVLDIETQFPKQSFDCVISQRCLINLPTWEHQSRAIAEIHDLLRDDGVLLLTEGFHENLANLNRLRKQFSLAEIKVVDYNRNLPGAAFESFVRERFDIVERRHYGAYLLLSRVYHPLVVSPEEPRHGSAFNRVAMNLARAVAMPDLEKYSYNLFYVLRKRRRAGATGA